MPKFYEIYGADVGDQTYDVVADRRAAYCAFTDSTCDGGGNRHQTKIRLKDSALRDSFDTKLESVVPGICSIEYGAEVWIVCPRRLLGFQAGGADKLTENHALQEHERDALVNARLPVGVELGVWPEVYLQYGDDDSTINYHFDFVIAPVFRNITFEKLMEIHRVVDADEIAMFRKAAKTGKYLPSRSGENATLPLLPDLESPFIVEVMTASTSGSDKEAGTDIGGAFANAILMRGHNCPGINKRQVWGRMATQLFAKSALALTWGGKTIWLVQDQLLDNIQQTTRLRIEETRGNADGTVNFLSMAYKKDRRGKHALRFDRYVEIPAGLSFSGDNKCADILLPKTYPDKKHLLKAVLRREIASVIRL